MKRFFQGVQHRALMILNGGHLGYDRGSWGGGGSVSAALRATSGFSIGQGLKVPGSSPLVTFRRSPSKPEDIGSTP